MRHRALPVALGLLATSFLLLYAGHFLRLDDPTGLARADWNLPLGYLAALAAGAAVAVSTFERRARQALGGALLLTDAVVFFWAGADDGFRFVWGDDEGELVLLQLGLVLLGLALMTPSFRSRGAVTGWARTVIYLTALVVVPLVALYLGVTHFERTQCVGTDGDCDLGFLEGLVWASVAMVALVVTIVVTEVTLRVRRSRRVRSRLNPGSSEPTFP